LLKILPWRNPDNMSGASGDELSPVRPLIVVCRAVAAVLLALSFQYHHTTVADSGSQFHDFQ
jgi:hypothetical protein